MKMDLINQLLALVIFINLILCGLLYLKGRKNPINLSYCSVILSVIFWTVGMILYRSAEPFSALFWCRILYIAATFTSSTFFLFTYIFPSGRSGLTRFQKVFIFIPNFAIIVLVSLPNVIIKDVVIRPGEEKLIIFGPCYFLYAVYILAYFFAGFWNLLKAYLKSKGITRAQIKYVFLGYFISANMAFGTNLLMPWWGNTSLNWLGQILTLIWIGLTTFAILKHHLMNIRVIATELLTIGIVLTLVIQTILSETILEFLLRFIFLIIVSFFALLLIRSVLREVRQREEIQRLAKKLKEANKFLKHLDELKSDFVSIVSHQLRTPISGVKGYLSMLAEGDFGKLKKKQKQIIDLNLVNIERLVRLIDIFLDISRIEAGRLQLLKSWVSLEDLIKSVNEELRPQAEKKGLKLVIKLPKTPLPQLYIDPDKIRNVIMNMIDNAIKYTLEGSITTSAWLENNRVFVQVKDTGIGIPKSEVPKLFTKFVRAGGGIKVNTHGSGLGLFIIRNLIKAHKGDVWVHSEGKNKGATFGFYLPLENQQK